LTVLRLFSAKKSVIYEYFITTSIIMLFFIIFYYTFQDFKSIYSSRLDGLYTM
jgi:hypothetical protein